MTSASFGLYVGPMFEVIAGLDHKCFLVHASILTKSDKFKAIVEGDWKECAEQKVVLEDWDESTVGRLVEWLYTGDYSSPRPKKFIDKTAVVDLDMQGALGGQEIISVGPPTDEALSTPGFTQSGIALDAQQTLVPDREDLQRSLTPLANQIVNDFTEQDHNSSTELLDGRLRRCERHPHIVNFEGTLLAHAKVYCLANYMLIPELQALAFKHLKSTITWIDSRIISKSPMVSALVTLIRYVYANTNRPSLGEEPLQKLLTTLVAVNFGCFNDGAEGKVRHLMDEGGDFGIDVWGKVSRHMGALRKELKESHKTIASWERDPIAAWSKRRRG